MSSANLYDWLRLSLSPGIGPDATHRLLARFGSPEAIFGQPASVLQQVVSLSQAHALCAEPPSLRAQLYLTEHWLNHAQDNASRAVWPLSHPSYPSALRDLSDPPVLLYVQGQLEQPLGNAISMVGSRNPTPQGAHTAALFAQALGTAGLTVISGMALGIDGAAHRGALQGRAVPGRTDHWATVAVVGTGLDRVYPRQHQALASEISQHGLVMSEYPLGTPPLAANFPKRNRLIAALGLGTLVVEAAMRSGSLITAQLALDLGREVLAVPGSIHAPQSHGCHALIKQGAKLVETAQDVLEELALNASTQPLPWPVDQAVSSDSQLPQGCDKVLLALGYGPVPLDVLHSRSGLDTAALQAALLTLELAGRIARMPGSLFQRL